MGKPVENKPFAAYYPGMARKKKLFTDPDDLLTTADAAAALGLSPRTVRQHAEAGHLAGRRVGRDWLFRRGDVAAFTPRPRGRPAR